MASRNIIVILFNDVLADEARYGKLVQTRSTKRDSYGIVKRIVEARIGNHKAVYRQKRVFKYIHV